MKVLTQLITNLYKWNVKRIRGKQLTKKQQEQEEQKRKVYKQLQELYNFVRFINSKAFKNRHERKAFWRAVREGKPALEDIIQRMVKLYEPKDNKQVIVKKKDVNVSKQLAEELNQ